MPEDSVLSEPSEAAGPLEIDKVPLDDRRPMSSFQLMSISAFWLATNIHWTALLAILLPRQIAEMTGTRQSLALGWTIGVSAIFPLVVPLIVGPLSDRCTSRFGRRRPFMFLGVAVNIVGLSMMCYFFMTSNAQLQGISVHFWGYFVGFIIVQIGNNIATGAYQGVIPDVVMPHQRGAASGYMGFMTQIGSALGIIAVGVVFRHNEIVCYSIVIGSLVLFLVWTSMALTETPLRIKPPHETIIEFLQKLWINPIKYPDFAWVWLTRALVMFGFYTVQPFVRYYLRDVVGVPNKDLDITSGMVFLIILIAATITGLYGGVLSDRIGRKKIVYWANGLMAAAAVALVFCHNMAQALTVGVFFGVGYGAYISVDWALGTDVLPNQEDAGKDMAVWHIAMVGPQSLAAPLAGWILARYSGISETVEGKAVMHYLPQGYMAIFGLAALGLALGAILLRNVRKVA